MIITNILLSNLFPVPEATTLTLCWFYSSDSFLLISKKKMLVSVSLDLSDWGIISDISYGFTQISSALPSSQSLSSPCPGRPSGHQLSLSCFHPRRPSGHMHRSASPVAPTGASDTACMRGRVNSPGSRFRPGEERKQRQIVGTISLPFSLWWIVPGTTLPTSLPEELLYDWVVTSWGTSYGYSWHFMKQWPMQ